MKKLWIFLIILIIVLPVAWYLLSPLFIVVEKNEPSPLDQQQKEMEAAKDKVMEKDEAMPEKQQMVLEGIFKPEAHEVEGKVLLLEVEDKKILRFEDFETVNGPDLRIYLSADLEANDFVEVGKIKATKGNVNYDLPATVDTEKYKYVLVWCKPFSVLFSYATLT